MEKSDSGEESDDDSDGNDILGPWYSLATKWAYMEVFQEDKS